MEKDSDTNTVAIYDVNETEGRAIETIVTPIQSLRNSTLVEVDLVTAERIRFVRTWPASDIRSSETVSTPRDRPRDSTIGCMNPAT